MKYISTYFSKIFSLSYISKGLHYITTFTQFRYEMFYTNDQNYTATEARSLLHEEASSRPTEKLTRQDATDPKQKAVTDYKEQVDRHPPPSTGKLKTRRTNTTTTDITTRSPISEQWFQEITR